MSRNDKDSDFTYKYFSLGLDNPVRVKFNSAGHQVNAEVPDPETQKLKIQTTMLSRLAVSPDTREIDEGTFEKMCETIFSQKKSPRGGELNFSP